MKTLNELANSRNKFVVIAIDETNMWSDDIAKRAGKIEGVYLVNLKEPIHLCELAISYEATLMRNFLHSTEGFTDRELEDIEGPGMEPCIYLKGSNRYEIKKSYKTGTWEQAYENELGNPAYC